MNREKATALAETAVTALLWGTSFPIIGYGIRTGLDPKLFVFLRFVLAAPIMVAVSVLLGKPVIRSLRSRAVWILGFLNAVGFLAQFLGQAYTAASVAALLVNLSILIASVGSAILLHERFTKTKLTGTALAILGVLLLTTGGDFGQLARSQLVGDALYLVSAATWGVYIIYDKRETDERRWEPIGVTSSIVIATAIFTSPLTLFTGVNVSSLSTMQWLTIGYTAVFNTALPFILYQLGLRILSATSSAIVLMLEIVTAVWISVAFFGEPFGLVSSFAAASILMSIFLVSGAEISGKSLSVTDSKSSVVRRAS